MVIEVRGVNFKNKGAELMLNAAVQKIRSELPNVRLAMKPGSENDFIKRAKLGLFQMAPSQDQE